MRGEDFAPRVFASGGEGNSNAHGRAIIQSLNVELTHSLGRTEAGTIISCHRIEQPKSFFRVRGEPSERVDGISLSLLVRREFAGHRAWQPYVDFSSGSIWTDRQLPAATSRLNFLTQAGAGVVLARAPFPLFFGVRVAHVSNAGLADHNPGWNVLSLGVGAALRRDRMIPRRSAPTRDAIRR
jgi:lipid A 3-O-deacylase PagL